LNSQAPQDKILIRSAQTAVIGAGVFATSLLYPLLEPSARVLLLPTVLMLSWMLGTHAVSVNLLHHFKEVQNILKKSRRTKK
jgi:hypothetical protein